MYCSHDPFVLDKDNAPVNVTQKPIDIYRNFTYKFCPPECIVLDICAGSGTSAVSAASLNRNSISIDYRRVQTDTIRFRLKNIETLQVNPPLFASCFTMDFGIKLPKTPSSQTRKPRKGSNTVDLPSSIEIITHHPYLNSFSHHNA